MILAGLTLVLLAGCSEDGQLKELADQQLQAASKAALHEQATATAAGQNAALLRATLGSGGTGWAEGDTIWSYSLESMKRNGYLLGNGAGSASATFTRYEGSEDYQDGSTIYTISSPKYLYGISARGKQALLTVTIPSGYEASEVGAQEGQSRMPVPFWGTATFGSDGSLETEMNGLTALLRVDCSTLPADAKALVLTTHSYTELVDAETPPEDGAGEPLSGTFDAILEQGAQLASVPIFYAYDTLRVDLTGASACRHLYIPVVAASYKALHVIAVTADHRFPYAWQGRVLKTYRQDSPFRPNTIVALEPESTGIRTPRISR